MTRIGNAPEGFVAKESRTRSGRRAALLGGTAVALLATAFALGCRGSKGSEAGSTAGDTGSAPGAAAAPTPAEFADGERLFNENCARCHGPRGTGTDQGPPFVHIIYEPHHHSDAAFQLAARNGVRAHHWSFGDMPPVPGVTPEQVTEIVGYVRWLQRQAGIE